MANKPNKKIINRVIIKDQLLSVINNESAPIQFRIILSLFIDVPLRSGDFKCIYKMNTIPLFTEYQDIFDISEINLLKNKPSLIQSNSLIFVRGTKKRNNESWL